MQGLVRKLLVLGLFFLLSTTSRGFIHESVRIRSLGIDFTGLIEDPYTDVFRNPAYLAKWEKGALTAEVLDAEESVFGTNLAIPTKWLNLGISYKVHGHITGYFPRDGQDFSGQRVASDLGVSSIVGLKKFQIVRVLTAKAVSGINLGADIQYLRDWVFGGEDYNVPPFYNQLPTAFQVRTGIALDLNSKWRLDGVLRYQRNRPRLQTGYIKFGYSYERDSSRFISFDTRTTVKSNSSGSMDEIGIFLSTRLFLTKELEGALIFSAERLKGDLPVLVGSSGSSTVSYYLGPTYDRTFSALVDSSIQHFQWKYRTGFSLSRTFPSQTAIFGGATITVTRTREFYTTRLDSIVQFRRDGQILETREKSTTSGGEKVGVLFTELSIPAAAELKPKGSFAVRFGLRPVLIINNWDVGSHYADLNTFYSIGLGTEFEKHIFIDAFAEEDFGNLRNWQIALRYVF